MEVQPSPLLIDAAAGRLRKLHHLEQCAAIDALGKLRDPEAVPVLLKAAAHDRPEVRRAAMLALGRVAGPSDHRAQTVLAVAAARDRDVITRCYAAIAIGRMGVPRGSATLCRLVNDPNVSVRGFAAIGLSLLARRNGGDALRLRTAGFLRSRLAGESLSSDATGAVVIALGILRDRDARPLLLKLFESKGPPALRGHIALALGLIGAQEAVEPLRKSLTTERDPGLQREVAVALGLLGNTGSVRSLVDLVRNGRTEYVRANAALALAHIGSPAASRAMIELLSSKAASSPARGIAAVALGHLLDRRPLPALFAVVEDFDYMLPLGTFHELLTIL